MQQYKKSKKLLLTLALVTGFGISVYSQTSTIVCTSYKENFFHNGRWVGWTNYWEDFYNEPSVRITNADDGYYRLKYLVDGEVIMDYFVVYDADETKAKRKSLGNQNIYCYVDADGDYVWTENVSLSSLTQNVNLWKNSNAQFYLWSFSDGYAIALR